MLSENGQHANRAVMSENDNGVMPLAPLRRSRRYCSLALNIRRDTHQRKAQSPIARVNISLFEPAEPDHPLPLSYPRSSHILKTLRRKTGDSFDVGVINGQHGKARIDGISEAALQLSFSWDRPPAPVSPIV